RDLRNLARRAHSAAWSRQYLTYDDITHSHATRTARRKLKRRRLSHHSYLCRDATTQEGNEAAAKFCGELLYCNHRSQASSNGRGSFKVQPLRSMARLSSGLYRLDACDPDGASCEVLLLLRSSPANLRST